MKQAPSSVLMVRPEHFGYNPETAESNTFQSFEGKINHSEVRKKAVFEFDQLVAKLRDRGINVLTFHSPKYRKLPDAVFPNNWVTFHEDGRVVIYPMLAKNRRLERRLDIIDAVGDQFIIKEIIDLSPEENSDHILEGSGSIVFDHVHMTAYANSSPRTSRYLFEKICGLLGYKSVFFKATDEEGIDIFHTNVMMNIGTGYAVICLESISQEDKQQVLNRLKASDLEIVEISRKQMKQFVGNMIQLQNDQGKDYLLMSDSAFEALTSDQKSVLTKYVDFIHSDISTIEAIGGGSARCMIAGIHLDSK
jgi:hypothetical protein